MKFKKYSSIENATRKKTVDYITETGNSDGVWVSTLKIHGANYGLYTDGEMVKRGKKSGFVEGVSFYGDHNFNYDENILEMFAYVQETCNDMKVLSIHGEIYGGKYNHPDVKKIASATQVQKEHQYRPDNDFIVFDIKVDGRIMNYYWQKEMCKDFGFLYVPELGIGTFKDMMALPTIFDDPLYKEFGLPKIEGNVAEGWVLKPIDPKFFGNGERIILKGKNPKMAEMQGGKNRGEPKPIYEMSDEGNRLKDALMMFLNENRLRNVLSHGEIEEVTQKDFGRLLGMFLQDAFGDFSKDNGVAYEALPKKEKQILKKMMNREGGDVIRPNFLNIIDREF